MNDPEISALQAELLRIIRQLPLADLEILRNALRKAREASNEKSTGV